VSADSVPGETVSPETLGVIRAVVFTIWLAEVVPDPLDFWGELPRSMHEPIGVLRLVPEARLDRLLEPDVLEQLKRVLVVLLVLAALGVRPYRPTAAATAALLTCHQAVLRGFTFVNHEELGLLASTYVLALFPAADGFALRRRRPPAVRPETYAAAVQAMALLLLIPYSEIAARRLVRGGPEIFVGDSLPHWLGALDALDREAVGIGPWLLARPALVSALKAAFALTTAFELVGPLCLIMPRLRRAWIPVIVGFHLANRLTLKLLFWQNTLLVLVLLTDSERWVSRAAARLGQARRRLGAVPPSRILRDLTRTRNPAGPRQPAGVVP
jgi:hypothetical protein